MTVMNIMLNIYVFGTILTALSLQILTPPAQSVTGRVAMVLLWPLLACGVLFIWAYVTIRFPTSA